MVLNVSRGHGSDRVGIVKVLLCEKFDKMKNEVCRALRAHIKIPLHGAPSSLIVVYGYVFNISCDSAGIEIDSVTRNQYQEKCLYLPVQVCPGNY